MTAVPVRKDRSTIDGAYKDEALDAALRPIDGADAAWQTYEKAKVAEALSDQRPSLPAAEAFARIDAQFAAYRVKNGL